MILNSYNWPSFAKNVAYPADPEDYCEAATERFMDKIASHVVDVVGVRYQFSATNKIKLIDFDNADSRARYDSAYLRYLEAVGKIEEKGEKTGFALLVEWLKFRQAAELERARWIARNMVAGVKEGYASASAVNFMATVAAITKSLVTEHRVKRDDISLIWGGSKLYSGTEKFVSKEEVHDILAKILRGEQFDVKMLGNIKKQLIASQAGLGELGADLRLGQQKADERQREIEQFQSGRSNYCIYTFKSGGVGLSLHHTDEFTTAKVRRKRDSNYAVEEDIPLIGTKPRLVFVSPTYSAIELVQALGRCPRITSLSNTLQTLVYYRGTIEQQVAAVTSQKLKCLKKVVRKNEAWADMISDRTTTYKKQEVAEELIEHENVNVDEEDDEDES